MAHMISKLLHSLSPKSNGGATRPASARPVAAIERLESRIAPATFVVTTFTDELDGGTANDPAGSDHKLSLREAISAANATPGPDIIKLKAGTYAIGLIGLNEDGNATGDFDITDDLTIMGAGTKTRIDGRGGDRVFDVFAPVAGIEVNFAKLTITGGFTLGDGGGVRAENLGNIATLNFLGATITNNYCTGNGGGIANGQGDVSLLKSHLDKNGAESQGGGLFINTGTGALTITSTTVDRNSAGNIAGGIADYSTGDFTLLKSKVTFNSADGDGGGGEIGALKVTIDHSTVANNYSSGNGGGLDVDAGSAGDISITKSFFSQNSARSNGGGLFCGGAAVTVTDSTFSSNSSASNGGGISNAGEVVVTHSFFLNNFTQLDGGGIKQTGLGNITITNSTFRGNVATSTEGGAIAGQGNPGEIITVTGSLFDSNRSGSDGGGIYADGSHVTIRASTFVGNYSGSYGGGIDDPEDGIDVIDSFFLNNFANGSGGGFNGENGSVKVIHSVISGNRALGFEGGGFSAEGGDVEIHDSTISGNFAKNDGGGFTADGTKLIMTGSTVTGNSALGNGGGILVDTSGTGVAIGGNGSFIINSTIAGNTAHDTGGGIAFDASRGGDLTILHATIAQNQASQGGGIAVFSSNLIITPLIHVGNTIVAKNAAPNIGAGMDVMNDANNTFGDVGGNLIGIVDGGTGFTVSTLVGTSVAPIDPKLGPLGKHGGATATELILRTSPAKDAGDDLLDQTYQITTDQRGKTRPHGAHVDIGAVEI